MRQGGWVGFEGAGKGAGVCESVLESVSRPSGKKSKNERGRDFFAEHFDLFFTFRLVNPARAPIHPSIEKVEVWMLLQRSYVR